MPTRDMFASYADAASDRLMVSVLSVPTLCRDDALRHLDCIAGAARR